MFKSNTIFKFSHPVLWSNTHIDINIFSQAYDDAIWNLVNESRYKQYGVTHTFRSFGKKVWKKDNSLLIEKGKNIDSVNWGELSDRSAY